MTQFLIKCFVKDRENTKDNFVRQNYGTLAGFVGIVCNIILFALKFTIGILTKSIAITADAINNLADSLSSVVAVISFKISNKAPDEDHPFGHGRTEYIAGLLVAFVILTVGLEFLQSSINTIINPTPINFNPILLVILAISMIGKIWLGAFNRHIGNVIQSPTLMATMQDSINDVITTGVVIIGMIASQFTTISVDGIIGVIVALFILWSGVNIAKDTLSPLMGQAADPEITKEIEQIICEMDDIIGVHDLIIHNYGVGKSLASIHAEVPADSDLVTIHNVIDIAEKIVWKKTGIYIVIHIDPIMLDDEFLNKIKSDIDKTIFSIDDSLSMHDFRVVDGAYKTNIFFDLVVPFSYNENDKEQLKSTIRNEICKINERYNVIITIEHTM